MAIVSAVLLQAESRRLLVRSSRPSTPQHDLHAPDYCPMLVVMRSEGTAYARFHGIIGSYEQLV